MGVLKYIPKRKEILDRRSVDGGYYEAECDVCGTTFYPSRSNAKYCSRSCNLILWRQKKVLKESIESAVDEQRAKKGAKISSDTYEIVQGMNNVINYLQDNFPADVYRKKGEMKWDMKCLTPSEGLDYGNFIITKISERKYRIEH
jgi:hypothetical protein|tara:strand:+ start:1137 stop:1571 length:435 start_codon:yes stop_codon:yes gene_type:complete